MLSWQPVLSVKGRREYVRVLTSASLLATPLPNIPGSQFANWYIATFYQELTNHWQPLLTLFETN